MKKRSFYIGWNNEMAKDQSSFLKWIIIPLFLMIPVLAYFMVSFQKPFSNHFFKLGSSTEITGTYFDRPVPVLKTTDGPIPEGFSNAVLLVGFGKQGAEGIIRKMEKDHGQLNGRKVTFRGSLIHGDGKVVFELTQKEKSLIAVEDGSASDEGSGAPVSVNLEGEILDPKCYFGVMKPGEGKIHKSCAIRCISGGIPPVFRERRGDQNLYYIIAGENGEKINKQILAHVGEQIGIRGKTSIVNGWSVLYIKAEDIYDLNM